MARILVVDDDPTACEVISSALMAAGHLCQCVHDGDQALATLRESEIDLVVLDLMLPLISGFEVCRRIRRDEELYTTPVLIISAMAEPEEIDHILSQGADDFVAKGSADQLNSHVSALLSSTMHFDTDEQTGLCSGQAVRREMQRRVSLRQPFAVAYVEMVNLRKYVRAGGAESRERAIRHLSRAIARCGEPLDEKHFCAGHMGGGHFVILLPIETPGVYCRALQKAWRTHTDTLPGSTSNQGDAAKASSPTQLLDLQICVTGYQGKEVMSAQSLFEILSSIRRKAMQEPNGGIAIDHRVRRKQRN